MDVDGQLQAAAAITPLETAPGTLDRRLGGPRADLETAEKRKISVSSGNRIQGVQPVAITTELSRFALMGCCLELNQIPRYLCSCI